jgi:type I restriction enzyme S subunit
MKSEKTNNTTVTLNHNNIPESWKKVKLGEVADLSKIPWKVGDKNLPYIGLEHIEENKLRLSGVGNSNDITSNKFLFTENEFLFGKLRPYFRKLYKPKFKGICSTDIWVINSKTNTNKEFLF